VDKVGEMWKVVIEQKARGNRKEAKRRSLSK
jgi:hypothetical protein